MFFPRLYSIRILPVGALLLAGVLSGCRNTSEPKLTPPPETASAKPAKPAPAKSESAPQTVSVQQAPKPAPASVQPRPVVKAEVEDPPAVIAPKIDVQKNPQLARNPELARRDEHLARMAKIKSSDQINPDRGVKIPNAGRVERSLRWKSDLPEKLSPGEALDSELARQQADVREAREWAQDGTSRVPPIITVEGADDVILLPVDGNVSPRDLLILLKKGDPNKFVEYQHELRGVMQRAMARPFDAPPQAQQALVQDMQAGMPWKNVYFQTQHPGAEVWYVPEGDTIEVQGSAPGPTPIHDKLRVGYYRIWTVRNGTMTGEQMVPIWQEGQKIPLKESTVKK